MKFKYLGDVKDMKVFGCDFSDGKTPDITDEKVIRKLSGNREFAVVEDGESGGEQGKTSPKTDTEPGGEEAGEGVLPLGFVPGMTDEETGGDSGGEPGGEEVKNGGRTRKG